jgi:predicted nucleotidyltransferase
MDAGLLHRLRASATAVFRESAVLVAYAHGSRVAGRPRPESDLDVGYYLAPHRSRATLPLREEMRLASALSEAMGFEVDLRSLADAPLELRGRVLEEGIRIYSANEADRVALECFILARYHDYKDAFRGMHEVRLRELARRGL